MWRFVFVNKILIFVSPEDFNNTAFEKIYTPYVERGRFYVQSNDFKLDEQIRKANKNAEYQLRAKKHVINNLRNLIKQTQHGEGE